MKYNTKGKKKTRYSLLLIIAVLAALAIGNAARANKPDWDVCYDMCNQYIEWTGAGYGG